MASDDAITLAMDVVLAIVHHAETVGDPTRYNHKSLHEVASLISRTLDLPHLLACKADRERLRDVVKEVWHYICSHDCDDTVPPKLARALIESDKVNP